MSKESKNKSMRGDDDEEYESYSETCKVYDIRRKAIGVEYISQAVDQVRVFVRTSHSHADLPPHAYILGHEEYKSEERRYCFVRCWMWNWKLPIDCVSICWTSDRVGL